MLQLAKIPMLYVSTVSVDNFVDNGNLMPGKHWPACGYHRKPGKKSKFFLFKISYLENAS
jgi:hypothetical protein